VNTRDEINKGIDELIAEAHRAGFHTGLDIARLIVQWLDSPAPREDVLKWAKGAISRVEHNA
jgi:hypothetical protein